jgi:hypothetical protein
LRLAQSFGASKQGRIFEKHHRRLSVAIALLAGWLVIQYLALILP